MEAITLYDTGAAVEDIQRKLVSLGYLFDDDITGTYDERTASAVRSFAGASGLSETSEVDEQVWARLVDATYELGDRVFLIFTGTMSLFYRRLFRLLAFPVVNVMVFLEFTQKMRFANSNSIWVFLQMVSRGRLRFAK